MLKKSVGDDAAVASSDEKKGGSHDNRLRVVVRKRPASEDEEDVVEVVENQVQVREDKVKVDMTRYVQTHVFEYDDSFEEGDGTPDVYHRAVAELIENFFGGGTSTCFCFGQTASGKTFTLFGAGGGQTEIAAGAADDEVAAAEGGVYLLAARDVFARLAGRPDLELHMSMFEIYGQKVRDLFDGGKELAALEDGNGVLQLVGLSQVSHPWRRGSLSI